MMVLLYLLIVLNTLSLTTSILTLVRCEDNICQDNMIILFIVTLFMVLLRYFVYACHAIMYGCVVQIDFDLCKSRLNVALMFIYNFIVFSMILLLDPGKSFPDRTIWLWLTNIERVNFIAYLFWILSVRDEYKDKEKQSLV